MEQLGVNGTLLLAQIVNFGLVVFLLSKLLFKPVLTMLEKRKALIDEGLQLTEKAKADADGLEVKRQKLLDTARREAQAIVNESKKQAEATKTAAVDDARKEASLVIKKAEEEAAGIIESAQAQIRQDAVDLALLMAIRALPEVLGVKEQQVVLAKKLKDLEKSVMLNA